MSETKPKRKKNTKIRQILKKDLKTRVAIISLLLLLKMSMIAITMMMVATIIMLNLANRKAMLLSVPPKVH